MQDLVLPTTMMVAAVAWALRSSHVTWDNRASAARMLDAMLHSCARTGKLKMQLAPEYVAGPRHRHK